MKNFTKSLVVAVLACSPALATPSARPLQGLGGPNVSNVGTVSLTPTLGTLTVEVDHAVWAPGTFNAANTVNVAGTFDASEYVYAYQVHNDTPGSALSSFGVTTGGDNVVSGLGSDSVFDNGDEDLAPNGGFIFLNSPDFAQWFFSGISTSPGYSTILLLSSPFAPTEGVAGVTDSGNSAEGNVPVPIPAPGAAILAMMGISAVGWVKRRFS